MVRKSCKNKPFVIQLLGSTKRKIEQPRATEYFVLMELCTGGNLMDLITRQQKRKLDEGRLAAIFYQIAVAVSHLHRLKPPVAHRDLKIENVLIGGDGEMRLCDFGSCTTRAQAYLTREEMTQEEERIQRYSTSMYRAPEMVDLYKKEVINEKVDIWALGCILYTLAFYVQPFQEGGNLQIIGGNYSMPEDSKYSRHVPLLIKKMLSLSPKKRPDIRKLLVLVDKWIAELRKSGEPVNIPQPKTDKKKKKKKQGSDDDDSDEDDDDEEEEEEDADGEENGEEEGKRAKKKPSAMQTSRFAGDDFATDFDAHSPSSAARAGQQPHMSSSASFPSFPQPAGSAAFSSASSPPAALPIPPHPRTLSNPPPPSQPSAKPAAVFDMSAFADSLIGPPGSAAATSPPPSQQQQHSLQQQRHSPAPAVSPRGLPPSGSVPSGFDFFGGSTTSPPPAASASPLALGKLPPPLSPNAAKAKAAAKAAAPASKSPTTNGAAAKKPHAPVKAAAAKKEESSDDDDSDDSEDSDDSDDDDEEDDSEDEDDRGKKGSGGKQPLRKTAGKK